MNEAFARKYFGNEDPIGKHFGPRATVSRQFEIVGVVRNARYFTNGIDKPTGPMYFLPEAQADYKQIAGALFLHDIVIAAKPGANVSAESVLRSHGLGGFEPAGYFDPLSARAGSQSVHATAAHRTSDLVFRSSFGSVSFYRALWRNGIQCRMPHRPDRREDGARGKSRQHCPAGPQRSRHSDFLGTGDRAALDASGGQISSQSALRSESARSS